MAPDRFFAEPDLAALYDSLCPRERRPDFDFYLPMVMACEAVLDVGCGTVAMLKEARTLGHRGRLVGLDPAAGMLAQARDAVDIDWVLGDLSSADLAGRFDLVVMTGHAFQVLLTDEAIAEVLTVISSLLAEGGRFAFETRNPLAREWEAWTPARTSEVQDAHGCPVRMARRVERFDGELLTFTHTFTSPDWRRPKMSRSTLRFIDAPRLNRLLMVAGGCRLPGGGAARRLGPLARRSERTGDHHSCDRDRTARPVSRSDAPVAAPSLVPELDVADIARSVGAYVGVLGFKVVVERPEEAFAYLARGDVHLMLEAADGPGRRFRTAPLEPPFGRGINLQIRVDDVHGLWNRVQASSLQIVVALEDRWYRQRAAEVGNRQFVVADPDGYLLRFYEDLGSRPAVRRGD